jgi:competence protein ComEA
MKIIKSFIQDEKFRSRLRKVFFVLFLFLAGVGGLVDHFTADPPYEEIIISSTCEAPETLGGEIHESEVGHQPEPAKSAETDLISINHATQSELEALNGIGASKALAIIGYRTEYGEFRALEELTEVKGIGPATYEKIKDHIRL